MRLKIIIPLIVLMIILAILAFILRLNDGILTYTLDDPYIHLALAEQLAQGHYGLNPNEAAAPSSSILYPFLLIVGSGSGWHVLLPLILNSVALIAAAILLIEFYRSFGWQKLMESRPWLMVGVSLAILFGANWIGLVFTGLEHSLHLLASLLVLLGLFKLKPGHPAPWYLLVGMSVGPLLRYEGLAVSLAAAITLLYWRRPRLALLGFMPPLILVIGFSLYLHSLGLGYLPSSVLVKSHEAAAGIAKNFGFLLALPGQILNEKLAEHSGGLMGLAGVGLAAVGWTYFRDVDRRFAGLALFGLVVIVAHLAIGQFGWFSRYEIYAYSLTLLLLLFFASALGDWSPPRLVIGATLLIAVAGAPYIGTVLRTPLAANNIYQQQFQLRRLLVDYVKAPAAVVDLGLATYHNPYPVLDLIGLGSEEARLDNSSHPAGWLDTLTKRHDSNIIFTFPNQFRGEIPCQWRKVGELALSRQRITPADDKVEIYAPTLTAAPRLAAILAEFKPTLPADIPLQLFTTDPAVVTSQGCSAFGQ